MELNKFYTFKEVAEHLQISLKTFNRRKSDILKYLELFCNYAEIARPMKTGNGTKEGIVILEIYGEIIPPFPKYKRIDKAKQEEELERLAFPHIARQPTQTPSSLARLISKQSDVQYSEGTLRKYLCGYVKEWFGDDTQRDEKNNRLTNIRGTKGHIGNFVLVVLDSKKEGYEVLSNEQTIKFLEIWDEETKKNRGQVLNILSKHTLKELGTHECQKLALGALNQSWVQARSIYNSLYGGYPFYVSEKILDEPYREKYLKE